MSRWPLVIAVLTTGTPLCSAEPEAPDVGTCDVVPKMRAVRGRRLPTTGYRRPFHCSGRVRTGPAPFLTPADQKTLLRGQGQLQYCFERALRRDEFLPTQWTVELSITRPNELRAQTTVLGIAPVEGRFPEELLTCVEKRVVQWRLLGRQAEEVRGVVSFAFEPDPPCTEFDPLGVCEILSWERSSARGGDE